MIDHSQRSHALLSASGASKWINCPPSARLEDGKQEEGSSEFAEEGTVAHEVSEAILRLTLGIIRQGEYNAVIANLSKHPLFRLDMLEEVTPYTDYVLGEYQKLLVGDEATQVYIESRLDLSKYAPDSFGTSDATIVGNGTLHVIDLKFGKGIKVDAEDNPQLKLYALGAYEEFGWSDDIKTVKVSIVQPRLDHISEAEMTLEELLTWGEEVVIPKAEQAYSGEGDCNPGKWCRWCKVKGDCRALSEFALEGVRSDFSDEDIRLMSDAEIGEVLKKVDIAQMYFKAVSDHAMAVLLGGGEIEGYKIVEGRSVRKITDESKAVEILKEDFLLSDEELYNKKLKGLGDLEKLVGKKNFTEAMGSLIEKPAGSPTLVPVSDKREVYRHETTVTNEFKSF